MNIKAEGKNLETIFYGLNTRYYIPRYQRNYSWTTSNELNELWGDIISAYNEDKEYFMGTILLATREKKHYDIVDGQQRAISFTLLLSVIQDYSQLVLDGIISDNDLSCNYGKRNDVASDLYAYVRRHIKHDDYYLRANNKDSKFFEDALDITKRVLLTDVNNRSNRITKAKRFFQDNIKKEFFGRTDSLNNLNKFFRFIISKLHFVTITVEDDFDAYVIFESLNSKGLDLSVADLLKNKILSNISGNYQDAALSEWDDLVRKIQCIPANFVDYIRIYWNSFESSDVTKANLYHVIRKNIGSNEANTKVFLNELVENAELFDRLKNKANLNWPKINSSHKWAENVAQMNLLGYTIHLPCFLYAMKHNEKILDRLSALSLNLLFRWVTICDYGIGEIDSLFKRVLQDLKVGKHDDEILKNFLPLIDKVQNTFIDGFSVFETESSTILKYIACKIEIYLGASKALIPDFLEVDLEHVLPKSFARWEDEMLNFSKPYNRWVNSVGNVILLEKGMNRQIKDSIFSSKRKSYLSSAFICANQVAEYECWNENSIIKRNGELSILASNIWPLDIGMCS
ncbi:DUF262 domain-containing HNH endonuclease family protein [Enterobacter quasihormaechei]|uniref:DUF262 domain-containing HNH endonuclease family protein n=1 Tax=Enterobacter quasihormaechei TaxID=2529382 RepID=A0ABU9PGY3_9ENTR|nr:DUF262 domain-containing protein [Enterobacter bugandensis]